MRQRQTFKEIFDNRPDEDAMERFERIAAAFEAETGYLRPGKDSARHDPEEREAAWEKWYDEKRAEVSRCAT